MTIVSDEDAAIDAITERERGTFFKKQVPDESRLIKRVKVVVALAEGQGDRDFFDGTNFEVGGEGRKDLDTWVARKELFFLIFVNELERMGLVYEAAPFRYPTPRFFPVDDLLVEGDEKGLESGVHGKVSIGDSSKKGKGRERTRPLTL